MSWLQDVYDTIDRLKQVKEDKDYAKIMGVVYDCEEKMGGQQL